MIVEALQAVADVAQSADLGHVGTNAVVAIAAAEIIEVAKRSGWRALAWLNADSEQVNRLVGGGVAFLTGLGISWSYDANTGTLVINGLLAASVSHAFVQWVQQQAYYRLVIARKN